MNTHLKKTKLFLSIIFCMLSFHIAGVICAETYEDGKIKVRHKELSVKTNRGSVQLNHPYVMNRDVIGNVLSQIYFEEKGLLKKKASVNVFQDDEITKLVPLIIQAFSIATPAQVIEVVSYSGRPFFVDKQNYCVMFIRDSRLNIVFSRVQKFQTYSDLASEKKGMGTAKEDPTKIKGSRFWTLLPAHGQTFEPGHKNWLVINISEETYRSAEIKKTGIAGSGESDFYSQSQKRGRVGGNVSTSSGYRQTETGANTVQRESKIRAKFLILRELLNDGILLQEDYDYKKEMLLNNGMNDMDIKNQLREIKDLLDEGLITEEDHSRKKKALLDLF